MASDDTVLHKSKFLTLLHSLGKKGLLGKSAFIARVLSAEITACITSLLSTSRQFAGKQPAECKGRNSLLVLAKNLQLIHLTKYMIFDYTSFERFVIVFLHYKFRMDGLSLFSPRGGNVV